MYRSENWKQDFYIDNHIKYKCNDCDKVFIVGRRMLADCPSNHPQCPYCVSKHVQCIVWTDDECLEELEAAIGCLALSFKEPIAINDLDLSTRTHNCLLRAGVTDISMIRKMSDDELRKIPLMNAKCITEIKNNIYKVKGI